MFCDSITRAPGTAFVTSYVLAPQNVAFIETTGADLTINYRFEPGDGKLGAFNLSGTVNYLDKFSFLPANGGIVDVENGEADFPEWSAVGDVTWTLDNFSLNYGVQYIGETLRFEIDVIAANPDLAPAEFLNIGDRFVHDVRPEFRTSAADASFFLGVNNFTNELPARGLSDTPTGWLGRFFYAGFRVNTDKLGF